MKSVYIHIPFCKNICNYCDFCKYLYNEKWVDDYLNALEKEIKKEYKKEKIKTLYIGGGTPSVLSLNELKKLFNIVNLLDLSSLEEFTIECNIEDINEELLKLLKDNKINRISIGIQSFNMKILNEIGRNADVDIKGKIDAVKKYFSNINVDLIYGYQNQTKEDVIKDIDEFLKLNVNHISIYALMIEPNTRFYNLKPIDDDIYYEMYSIINKKLEENNYIHYEISNYAKKGYESKHNLVYWNNEEYYGFGVSSSSYIGDKRTTNTKNFTAYILGINKKEIEKITLDLKIKYELILGFRKIKGINKKEFYEKYHKDIIYLYNIKELIDKKYLIDEEEYIYINPKYLYIQNEILINFI